MNFISATTSGYASTAVNAASTLSSYTTNLDWVYKGWTFLLFTCEYYWGLFPLRFNFLFHHGLIICCYGYLLERVGSWALLTFLGFDLGYLIDFTVIFLGAQLRVRNSFSSQPDIVLTRICSEYLFIGSNWLS